MSCFLLRFFVYVLFFCLSFTSLGTFVGWLVVFVCLFVCLKSVLDWNLCVDVSQILRSNKFAYFEGTVWGEKKTHMYRGTLPLSNPFLPNGAQRITVEAYFAPGITKKEKIYVLVF